ncbi:ATP-binding protein [Sedimentimonas flavescens]|uniref:histidine kinase n=1 Tax=Sedimentimonas flavescens TaxID=2851012 RepID=A0ABT3A047_9RHOB|nr:ATP-binding protein [Sedimentimonas flavescens]MCV2879374.1 ATP-binding protein [Sedimentimonas flavescens]
MIMARFRHWAGASVQRKLILALGGLLIVVSALFLVVLSSLYRNQMISVHARAAGQINELLQGALENAMLKRDIPGLVQILDGLGRQDDIERVMIVNPDFEVRFSSDPARVGQRLDSPALRDALESRTPHARYLDDGMGEVAMRSINPVLNRSECRQCHGEAAEHPVNGLLVVDYRAGAIRREALSGAIWLGLLGMAVVTLASAAMWIALRRMVIAPLERLTAANRALAEGHLDTRLDLHGRDEIADLGQTFNRMSSQIEAQLATIRHSEAELQALLDALPDGVRVIGPDFRILRANRAYCLQTGHAPETVAGSFCYASSHGRDTPCPHTLVTCPVVELIEKGASAVTFRDRHHCANGARTVEVSSARIDLAGNGSPCVVEAIRDLDTQARISQEERLSEIGLLAAGVAHEIFNPLSSVELALAALAREFDQGRPERARAYFDTIRSEVGKCIEITDNLLMLSAPPGEGRQLIELDRVVSGVSQLLNYQAEQGGITMHTELAPGLRVIATDADLRMLMTNLIMNAFHAMPTGGIVTLRGWREAGKVHLSVSDLGIGIAAADLERIFMPFWSRRADSSMGRGLGLSIVRGILDRHGATIDVESNLGQGSVFTVAFPDPDTPEPDVPQADVTPLQETPP